MRTALTIYGGGVLVVTFAFIWAAIKGGRTEANAHPAIRNGDVTWY